jgi:hypothetical protein
MTEEEKMTIVIKKPMQKGIDLQSMVDKIREITAKKWRVTYTTNKEDRVCEVVSAKDYTEAYLAFTMAHKPTDEITYIKEV